MNDYPYMRAFYALVYSYKLPHEVEDAVARARSVNAPEDITHFTTFGTVRTMADIQAPFTRDWINAYINGENPALPWDEEETWPTSDEACTMKEPKGRKKKTLIGDTSPEPQGIEFDADIHQRAIEEATE